MRAKDLLVRIPRGALTAGLILGCVSGSVSTAQTAGQKVADQKVLTLDGAKQVADAAQKTAVGNQWKMVIAILDNGGNLIYLERMDGAPLGSIQISQQKAHTAVIFKSPSKVFAEGLAKGDQASMKLDIMPYAGGNPLMLDGKMVGAIGVSGGTADQDNQVSLSGVAWFTQNVK